MDAGYQKINSVMITNNAIINNLEAGWTLELNHLIIYLN